jgi:hypothetical protein
MNSYPTLRYCGRLTAVVTALLLSGGLRADSLQLKNGTMLKGTYNGGDSATVRFSTNAGEQTVASSEIATLTFDKQPAGAAQTSSGVPSPVTPPPAKAAAIPVGTALLVTMVDAVSSSDNEGKVFRTKLLFDLTADNVVVAPAGTLVTGKVQSSTQAKRARGKSTLDIRLHEMNVSGRTIPIATEGYQEAGEASAKKVAKSAAAGAIVGAITGDAGDGAAIGAGVGVLRRGESVTITPGTLLEFKLAQPLTFQSP